ncbi:LOW QUALITY PROTEIN: hydrocephalus-inducing protein homolog [Chamaea fasciata]|uniref:LOW QUALITY PROTEIN: hydrocephalus-inducing protein homolog n=1 Tax=Chamaea fasciata TaxID=190680 RepID=UPI00336AD510
MTWFLYASACVRGSKIFQDSIWFRLTDGGHHFHQLFWKVECNRPAGKEGQSTSAHSSPKAKRDSQRRKRTAPVFGLEPLSMDLKPGESVDLVLPGFSRKAQVSMESSPYFQLAGPSDACRAVPGGAITDVHVHFTPDENKVYSHELVCVSGEERIVVPIRAIPARAILDFPDELDFSKCPVKGSTRKSLLIQNCGSVAAHYQLGTESPFSVVPAEGILGPGHTMQVTVGFHPLTRGDHFGSLVARCIGEESFFTFLRAEAADVNIGLSTYSMKVEKTFITTSSHTSMFIRNRSNITAHFQWKMFPTEEADNEEKRSQKVQEEKAKLQEDPLLFSNDFFFIEPMEGEIGPRCSAEIKVTFKPLEALEYQSVAYCDISGRESRLALHLRGEGRRPLVELSCDTLNLGEVFVKTAHTHEVKLMNKGVLDAPFTYIPSNTEVGCCFKFVPEEGLIAPGGIQTIQISLDAAVLGRFEEPFQFRVAGSPTPVILTIEGCVVGPTLHFDTDELDFGDISFGFPYTKTCRLTNTSRVSDDGTQPAVSSFEQILSDSEPSWREGIHFSVKPREFTLNPSERTLQSQEHQDIEVTLCSNTVTEYNRKLLVDLEWFGKGVASLIIKASISDSLGVISLPKCFIPELQVYPQNRGIHECDLKAPFVRKFFIWNNTHLPGCYGLIPQACKPHCYVIEPREGVIPARGDVPVTVTATLDDTGVFADALQLFIGNRLWTTSTLLAFGTGTTIVTDKPFAPELNLGYQFSLLPCAHQFRLTDGGHHFHQLFWKVECNRPAGKEGQSTSAHSSPKAKRDSQRRKHTAPVFGLEPLSMDLKPGESVDLVLPGFSRKAQVSMESSPYFQLAGPSDACRAVPGGAITDVHVHFTPDENKVYSHELVCVSGEERIVVPIRAIPARAILDFPDELDFSKCPVKGSTRKSLLIQNCGSVAAHYQLGTESPFSVVPAEGILGPGHTMQVTVGFHPLTRGDHFGSLVARCIGEESFFTFLRAEAADVNIGLSTYSLKVEKTFITTSSHTSMFIRNRSNITAHFQWKMFPTEEADNEEKRRQCDLLEPPPKVWMEDFMEEKKIKKVKGFCENRTSLLSQKVQEEKAKVQEDPLLFSNDFFFIEPMEGEIGPRCSAEIKVTFKPLEALEYQSVAYCDISGRESRLALHLRGEGRRPLVELSCDTLNLGEVFVKTAHTHEVKLMNKGVLDAPFTYIPSNTEVGCCFKFVPEEGLIAPGGIQTIQISLDAAVLGRFEEPFQFRVAGSPTPVILTIEGCVVGPTLHFDTDELDFGDISFGFPYTKTCRLTNTSRVSDDGTQPAVSSFEQILSDSEPSWREGIHFSVKPREFTLNPSERTLQSQEHQDIEVTLCSNTVTEYNRKLLVDLEWFGKGVASLIIKARCFVPELQVYPQNRGFHECDLKAPFVRKFFIWNNTHLPGCYGLIPQEPEEDSPVLYSSPRPCGILQPRSAAEIPVTVEIQRLGKRCTSVCTGVFGDARNPLRTELQSLGRLSAVYISPRLIEFGRILVLRPNSQAFGLFNEGLVDLDFRLEIACKPHCYVIEPREGVIPARGDVPVTVTATLDDTGVFADALQLFIGNRLWTTSTLLAFGTGTTIVTDKPFAPELNLGYQFSLLPCARQFRLTDGGHHFHQLFWKVECNRPAGKEGQSTSAHSSPKAKRDSQRPERTAPVFGLEPLSMDLKPGESVDLVLPGFSRKAQVVQNYAICEAVIGTGGSMKKITEATITCEFIDPTINLSARQFSFRVEKKPSDVLTLQYQPLAIKNTCRLPLDLMLYLEQPFQVCSEDQQPLPHGQPVTVDVGQTCHLYIAFDPAYGLDFNSWKTMKILKIEMVRGHPYVERITLCGEAHFPNLQIQPSTLEFGGIVAGTKQERSLEMTNCSPLPVKYHWSFQMDDHVKKLRHELCPPKSQPKPPTTVSFPLDKPATQWRHFKIRKAEEPATALEESRDLGQSSGAEVPPRTWEKYYVPPGLEGVTFFMDLGYTPLETEKVFSTLPVSGVLQPGETQQASFTFFGLLDTIARVTALCHVEGGPTYKVKLTGEASRVSYLLSSREIDCGLQMFNEIHHTTVTLENTCKIKFNWVLNPSTADQDLPGVFLVKPTGGSIAPGETQELNFSYVPGLPGAFSRTYHLKVGDLEPESIRLKGEASFPMFSVNLPWNIKGNEKYKEPLERHVKQQQQPSQRKESAVVKKTQSPKTKTLKSQPPTRNRKTQNRKPGLLGSGDTTDAQLQIIMAEKAGLEVQQKLSSHPPKSGFPDEELLQSLINIEPLEYVLDLGSVFKGCTERRTLEITNPGEMLLSFRMDVSVLQDTGFSVDLDQMEDLPPRHTVTFEVCFESACRPQGDVDVLLPIKVEKGPTSHIRLHAAVVELSLRLSKNTLEFSDTLVGQCQTETVRLYNWFHVPCTWFITAIQPVMEVKTPALHQKKQALEDEPCPFEVMPSEGTLEAGSWQDLKIRFTPNEDRSYKNELKLNVCESSNCLMLHLSGQGLEPRLEFSPPALEMGWVLVDSDGVEATVVVKIPCNFPIEFYSLDFDEQYLEEEKILRTAVGSEYQKKFLMPPRAVGETLPPELLEYYEAQKRLNAQQGEVKAMAEAEAEAMGEAEAAHHRAVPFYPEAMVKATGNPVSRAVIRHLGIDQSSERCEAQQDKGIVVIVHGPPLAGKTEMAAALCHHYDAAPLSLDTVVKEAIANDGSQAGLRARELCTEAAMELKSKNEGNAAKKRQLALLAKRRQASQEKMNKKNAKGKSTPAQKKTEPASKPQWSTLQFTVSTAPAPQQMNITSSCGEELNCLSCVLPEDLLVEILCERLKHEDCCKGVVFDGLESLFARSLESSLLCVLTAVKNRHYIYVVHVHRDYASWKARKEAEIQRKEDERQREELQREEALQRNRERALRMDEEEYDALPEEEKAAVDEIIWELNHMRRERRVSDTENILGIVQAENIKISAKVYDVSLRIDMPEGPDGSLEFGTINVLDKVKKVLSLKNKGVYNIEYSFTLKGAGPRTQNLASHFSVEPRSGMLTASQPGVNIEMLFHPTSEIFLKNKPILYCQVIDGSSGEGGQTVAEIPLRVSARAVYSKYSIEPASPIDFGAMLEGTKKTQTVILENKGMLSFEFYIHQAPEDASAWESQSSKQEQSAPSAAKRSTGKKSSSLTQGPLSLGMFTVSPCSGSVGPWGQQKITVECLAGQEGTCEEQLYIDITGRDPRDNPLGIPFTLTAESCLPGLVEDVLSIFKEYPICSSTDLSRKLRSVEGVGLFIRDGNKFIFNEVLVAQEAEAHFNIYHASSLPCDVVLSIRPLRGKDKSPVNNVFKLYAVKMSIQGSSCAVATVTFTPPDEQTYDCTFKASLVIPEGPVKFKPQILTFTISGKGHEPQLTVVCPSACSRRGNSELCFKRLRLGESEMLPLVIQNKGIIPVKFTLHLEDEHGAFLLKGRGSTLERFYTEDAEDDSAVHERKPPKPFLLLRPGESTKFDVIFKPTLAQRLEGRIRALVGDKYSNKTLMELVGEGHKDEFTLDGLEEGTQERNAESILKKDIIDAVRANHIQFGDCSVGEPCNRTFTITNHTCTKVMRFEWEANAPFQFSPKVGHLHPGCAKDITVTLKSDVPATFRRHLVKCKVTEINFELPGGEVQDCDNKMRIVTWNQTTREEPAARWPGKRKVVKRVPEPAHAVLEDSSQEAELYLSAVVACNQLKLNTTVVQLKDPLPFQTRRATFRMHNTAGKVALEYSWEEAADSEAVKKPFSTTLMRRFLSSATVRHQKKLVSRFWWEQDHPFEIHPSELWQLQQLAEQHDSEQQQQQQQEEEDSKEQQQPEEQQLSEEEWLYIEEEEEEEEEEFSEEPFYEDEAEFPEIDPNDMTKLSEEEQLSEKIAQRAEIPKQVTSNHGEANGTEPCGWTASIYIPEGEGSGQDWEAYSAQH